MVDVIIGLFERDRFSEGLDHIVMAIEVAFDNDMQTEEILDMSTDMINDMVPDPPRVPPYLPQLGVKGWDSVLYGEAAFRNDE